MHSLYPSLQKLVKIRSEQGLRVVDGAWDVIVESVLLPRNWDCIAKVTTWKR